MARQSFYPPTRFKSAAYRDIGTLPGQVPICPLPMSAMPSVKTKWDKISTNSAAYKTVSFFATAAQGVLAGTALQSVPDATTSVKGIAKKSDTLSAPAAGAITNNLGGSILGTIPVLGGALYATDAAGIKNALTTAFDQINKLNARVEDLITKLTAAGVQT